MMVEYYETPPTNNTCDEASEPTSSMISTNCKIRDHQKDPQLCLFRRSMKIENFNCTISTLKNLNFFIKINHDFISENYLALDYKWSSISNCKESHSLSFYF